MKKQIIGLVVFVSIFVSVLALYYWKQYEHRRNPQIVIKMDPSIADPTMPILIDGLPSDTQLQYYGKLEDGNYFVIYLLNDQLIDDEVGYNFQIFAGPENILLKRVKLYKAERYRDGGTTIL